MSGCAKDGFEVVRSYCLELARTKATSIFARSLPMEPFGCRWKLHDEAERGEFRICARGAPVANAKS